MATPNFQTANSSEFLKIYKKLVNTRINESKPPIEGEFEEVKGSVENEVEIKCLSHLKS